MNLGYKKWLKNQPIPSYTIHPLARSQLLDFLHFLALPHHLLLGRLRLRFGRRFLRFRLRFGGRLRGKDFDVVDGPIRLLPMPNPVPKKTTAGITINQTNHDWEW